MCWCNVSQVVSTVSDSLSTAISLFHLNYVRIFHVVIIRRAVSEQLFSIISIINQFVYYSFLANRLKMSNKRDFKKYSMSRLTNHPDGETGYVFVVYRQQSQQHCLARWLLK